MGYIAFIGMNAALPVFKKANVADRYKAIMDISLAVINSCDALLLLAESPGANKGRDLIISKGLPVYYSSDEIPTQEKRGYLVSVMYIWNLIDQILKFIP